VWQTAAGGAHAPGSFGGIVPATCGEWPVSEVLSSIAPAPAMAGAAVVNVDGELLGVMLPCDERLAAIAATEIDAMLATGRSQEGRLLAAWGFRADPLSLDEAAFFKTTDGLLVREVWHDSAADRAGLQPGDILRAINDQPVETPEALDALIASENAVVTVRRGTQMLELPLVRRDSERAEPSETPPALGFVWNTPGAEYRIESVLPGSAAAKAGIRSGDLLLRINHTEPRNMAEVQRLLTRGRATGAFVELRRRERRWGALLL
jgi:S1-C subfamily serine protease